MRDLRTLTNPELEEFFASFDTILSDVDGVLWNLLAPIPGATDAVKSLRKIGKKVIFVSNNSTKSLDIYAKQFERAGIDADVDDVVTPIPVIVDYLTKQNLPNRKVFVLGQTPLRDALKTAGFQLAENGPDRIKETLPDFAQVTTVDDGSVNAVVADIDVNLNYVNLQQGITYLRRPDVLFLKGATDRQFPAGLDQALTGPGYFHDIMEDMAGREALPMAKPSPHLHNYIVEKYKIKDISRVLFIGDTIAVDMGFATQCGYRKLLVLSGLTTRDDVDDWEFSEEFKPDYYVDSLRYVHDMIVRLYGETF